MRGSVCKTGQASISAVAFKRRVKKTRIRAVCGYLWLWFFPEVLIL